MTVARQEMERDNLDYTSLEIIITFLLASFTEMIAYAMFDAFLNQIVGFRTFSLLSNYLGFSLICW